MTSKNNKIFTKPYIIAEIGVNYYDIAKKHAIAPMDAAKLMIEEAKKGGADAAKFQSYKANTLASVNSPAYWDQNEEPTESQYELFKKFDNFGAKEYEELAHFCVDIGIDFLSTPFDLEAVDFLDVQMKYFKIASADITNFPLIRSIAKKNKPILLSTGASTIDEINTALKEIRKIDSDIMVTLLHCVLSYPTKNIDANLNRISILKSEFPDCEIGYSDHTLPDENMAITTAAFTLGATVIEKHFTLDKNLKGNDHYHAMDVDDLKKMRANLDLLNEILSVKEREYLACEKVPRMQARRSLVARNDMPKGKEIEYSDLICKRPGTGISPVEIDNVVGKKVKKDIKSDDILIWEKIK